MLKSIQYICKYQHLQQFSNIIVEYFTDGKVELKMDNLSSFEQIIHFGNIRGIHGKTSIYGHRIRSNADLNLFVSVILVTYLMATTQK